MPNTSNPYQFGEPRPHEKLQVKARLEAAFAAPEAGIRDQSQKFAAALSDAETAFRKGRFQKLPPPTGTPPFRIQLADIIGAQAVQKIEQARKFVFHSVGDTGQHGHGAEAQESVSFHMEQQIKAPDVAPEDVPVLFYHLGDVVYYNGELKLYPEQFYDPYQFYTAAIIAIPGNHDGDPVPGDDSLSAFVENFCKPAPETPPTPGLSQRLTMTQPNIYFTLQAPFITIIGLYSNVTGDLDDPNQPDSEPQFDWFVKELQEADPGKFLVVAVHHPPFSADNVHGGEMKIGHSLDTAFEKAGLLPHLVLTAHVHDYQKFLRNQQVGNISREIPYIVAGAGGYAGFDSLHHVYDGLQFPPGVSLVKSNDKAPGFLRITVSTDELTGEYFTVPRPPDHISEDHPATKFDSFKIQR